MTHETGEQLAPFPTLHIPESDMGWMDETERYQHIIEQLQQTGLYDPSSLYCGVDGEQLMANNSFGNRQDTWAVDEAQFKQSAADVDHYGTRGALSHDPLQYAFQASEQPALAVYDQAAFDNLGNVDDHTEFEWRLKPGQTMDQATRAVIYLF